MALYCLVFTSIATQKMTDEDLKIILYKMRPSNCTLNITGILLYLDPFFMQILEGEERCIDELFNVSLKHTIHHKVSLIYKNAIEKRSFAKWSMGCNKKSMSYFDDIQNLDAFYESESFKKHPIEVVELLKMFKDETLF